MPGLGRSRVPFSQRPFEVLSPTVTEIVHDDKRYEKLFDQIEYLFGLACSAHAGDGIGPVGLGAYRGILRPEPPDQLVQNHCGALIDAGIFTDNAHLEQCRNAYNTRYASASQRW